MKASVGDVRPNALDADFQLLLGRSADVEDARRPRLPLIFHGRAMAAARSERERSGEARPARFGLTTPAALTAAYGVEPAELFKVMTGTLFAAPAYKTYAEIIGNQRFTPAGFKLPLGLKDVRLALQAAEAENTPLPIASLLRDCFIEAIAQGDADKDWAALAAGAFRKAGRAL